MDESSSAKHGRRNLPTPGRKAEQTAAKGDDPLREVRRSIHEGEAAWPKGGLAARPALGRPGRLGTAPRPFYTPGEVEASDLRLSQRRPSVPGAKQ